MKNKLIFEVLFSVLIGFWLLAQPGCRPNPATTLVNIAGIKTFQYQSSKSSGSIAIQLTKDIRLRGYFDFMDGLVAHFDTLLNYRITEHIIVQANPWLIDSLESTDYYRLMEKDRFIYDPQSMVILHENDSLLIPDSLLAAKLDRKLHNTVIDINIPEYKLRIVEFGDTLFTFPVRVGRDQKKYLALAKSNVDLRTRPGKGTIVRINRNAKFINPSNAKEYKVTRRDDGKVTLLPNIPWLEPEVNGHRYGQLIHPTTNPKTLGKAYSNGCIGTSEAAGWRIYYHAPLGTKVNIRYDLEVVNLQGDTIKLKDIYPGILKEVPQKEIEEPIASIEASPCPCPLL